MMAIEVGTSDFLAYLITLVLKSGILELKKRGGKRHPAQKKKQENDTKRKGKTASWN